MAQIVFVPLTPPGVITDADFAGTFPGHLIRTGASAYAALKNNLVAVVDPTPADNFAAGYGAGSIWVNQNFAPTPRVFILAGENAGNAVWLPLVDDASVLATLAALSANPSFNSKRLTSVADPTGAQDAATKNYVDSAHPLSWARKTATFTLSITERVILIDTAVDIECDLPDPTTVAGVAWTLMLQRNDPGDVLLDRFGGEKIQGLAANYTLTGAWSRWTLFCDGTDFFFI